MKLQQHKRVSGGSANFFKELTNSLYDSKPNTQSNGQMPVSTLSRQAVSN